MVALDLKNDIKTTALPLALGPKEAEGTTPFLAFLQLLQEKDGAEILQNGSEELEHLLIHQKEQNTQEGFTLKTLSSFEQKITDIKKDVVSKIEPLELNRSITSNLSISELKIIIQKAKQYLQQKIVSLEGFKKNEIASMPKTLKGLVAVAKKYGIEVSKITLDDIKQEQKPTEIKQSSVQPQKHEQIKQEPLKQYHSKTALKDTPAGDIQEQKPTEIKQSSVQPQKHEQIKQDVKIPLNTPLFQQRNKQTDITTQQLVSSKQSQSVQKNLRKEKSSNTLELLLQGEKILKQDKSLTSDFSVASARVIASNAKTQQQKDLESLLHGDSITDDATKKADSSLHVKSADSFEVKINEAKQMIKYLSHDVKQAIEDYKAPFTRVKVQLNPQKLGEIDLTVVQRGKNLHVHLSSNNAAINTLALNANDLKVQLQNNGIQNASLNFSSGSQSEQQNGSGSQPHQQGHNNQNASKEYDYFETEETLQEMQSTLEIVVPHYA